MFTKPKSTTKLPLAMLYKRYVAIESAFGKNSVYYVVDNLKRKYFIFDSVNEEFIEIREDEKGTAQEVQILYNRAFSYNDKYYKYNVATKKKGSLDVECDNLCLWHGNWPIFGKEEGWRKDMA